MRFIKGIPHALTYGFWLVGQLLSATWTVTSDTLTGSKKMDPCIVHYPLRVTSDWAIAALAASITITPGTMSLELIDPLTDDHEEEDPHALLLAVQAVQGSDPDQVIRDIAHMEEKLSPEVKSIPLDLERARTFYPAPKPVLKESRS